MFPDAFQLRIWRKNRLFSCTSCAVLHVVFFSAFGNLISRLKSWNNCCRHSAVRKKKLCAFYLHIHFLLYSAQRGFAPDRWNNLLWCHACHFRLSLTLFPIFLCTAKHSPHNFHVLRWNLSPVCVICSERVSQPCSMVNEQLKRIHFVLRYWCAQANTHTHIHISRLASICR